MVPWYKRKTNITLGQIGRRWANTGLQFVRGNPKAAAYGAYNNLKWMGNAVVDAIDRPAYRAPNRPYSIPFNYRKSTAYTGRRIPRAPLIIRRPSSGTLAIARSIRPARVAGKRRRSFNTRGRFVGPFARGRSVRPSKFAKQGFKMRTEAGGSVSQDKCVYIGHSTGAMSKLSRTFWHSVVRALMARAGHRFSSFKERISPEATVKIGTVRIDYAFNMEGTETQSITCNLSVTDTYEILAQTMETNWITTCGGATSHEAPRLRAVRFIAQADEASGADVHEFKLDMTRSTFTFSVSSNMKIQNRTLASTGAGDTEHQYHSNSVENNPLQGKSYFKVGNGYIFKWSDDSDNTFKLIADSASSLITGDPDNATLSTALTDVLSRPPSATSFHGVKASGAVRLGPGVIKSSNLKYTKTLSVAQFLKAMIHYYEATGVTNELFPMATSRMFAFEKMMHTDDADEPDMNIGYEINNFYQGVISTRSPTIVVDKDVL